MNTVKKSTLSILLSSALLAFLTNSFTQAAILAFFSFILISISNIVYAVVTKKENDLFLNIIISFTITIVVSYFVDAFFPIISNYLEASLVYLAVTMVWFNHFSKNTGCTVKVILKFILIILVLGFFKELLSSGAIELKNVFDNQSLFKLSLFESYKITLFKGYIGTLLILSSIVAIVTFKEEK